MNTPATPRILIIAGSDSGGGAGIQADIKTVTMLGGHAMTAVTAITAQNTLGVTAVHPIPTEMVLAQIDAVVADIGVDAVKIGMIGSAETARAIAERLDPKRPGHEDALPIPVVFDPVMVATSGASLADAETIAAFEALMARATLVTPNVPELEALSGRAINDWPGWVEAASTLANRTGTRVLAKGGHLDVSDPDFVAEGEIADLLYTPGGGTTGVGQTWAATRIDTRHTHGTGCTLASAIATGLGRGETLEAATTAARAFVRAAMLAAPGFGAGHGPMGHWAATAGLANLNQVTLPADDYDASAAFYRSLGFTQIVDSRANQYARFEMPGGATLSVQAGKGLKAGDAEICIECAGLDAWVERLVAAGVAFESGPQDKSWGWREAHLRDPAGNRLILYWAGENRRFPPWRIG